MFEAAGGRVFDAAIVDGPGATGDEVFDGPGATGEGVFDAGIVACVESVGSR